MSLVQIFKILKEFLVFFVICMLKVQSRNINFIFLFNWCTPKKNITIKSADWIICLRKEISYNNHVRVLKPGEKMDCTNGQKGDCFFGIFEVLFLHSPTVALTWSLQPSLMAMNSHFLKRTFNMFLRWSIIPFDGPNGKLIHFLHLKWIRVNTKIKLWFLF